MTRRGVLEQYLAHPTVRRALVLALAHEPEVLPEHEAERLLTVLWRAIDHVDGIDLGLEWQAVAERQPVVTL